MDNKPIDPRTRPPEEAEPEVPIHQSDEEEKLSLFSEGSFNQDQFKDSKDDNSLAGKKR